MQPPQLEEERVIKGERVRSSICYSPGASNACADALLDRQGHQALQVRMGALVELPQTVMRLLHELAQLQNVLLAGATLQLFTNLTEFNHAIRLCRRLAISERVILEKTN